MRQLQLQIQDRGIHSNHTFRQRDPDLQMDLQSDLQEDPPLNLQADLQKDLQMGLQMTCKPIVKSEQIYTDLKVKTGLGATQHSPLVLFQAETSTEREKPVGGT